MGPVYGKRIGGRFYDLSTKANQCRMKRYRLGPGESAEESDEKSDEESDEDSE